MNILPIFPILLGTNILSEISSDEITSYKQYLKGIEYKSISSSNNGFNSKSQSSINQYILEEPIFLNLKTLLLQNSINYLNTYEFEIENIKISSSWATLANLGDSSFKHSHSNSLISGVYYLDYSSEIHLFNPTHTQFIFNIPQKEEITKDSLSPYHIYIKPIPNTLLLFPSYLMHQIQPSDKDNRLSIAFNIVPKGEFGPVSAKITL